MSLQGINGNSPLPPLSLPQGQRIDGDADDAQQIQPDQTSVSGPAKLWAQLQQLQTTNPAQFKQVMSQIADQLRSQAGTAGGTQATELNKVADLFAQAAQTGDLTPFQSSQSNQGSPTQTPKEPHGHHHRHGAGQYGGGSQPPAFSIVNSVISQVLSSAGTTVTNGGATTTTPTQ